MNPVFNTIIGALLGFGAAILAEPLRRLIWGPKLELRFEDSDAYKTSTIETVYDDETRERRKRIDAHYVRVRVENKKFGIAKNCRPYLVAVEREESAGHFEPTIYCDSIPLAWSCSADRQTAYSPRDLPKGVKQFIDVVSTRSISDEIKVEINPMMNRYVTLFRQHMTFRFTVLVCGENVKPALIRIRFKWNGNWDQFEATLDS